MLRDVGERSVEKVSAQAVFRVDSMIHTLTTHSRTVGVSHLAADSARHRRARTITWIFALVAVLVAVCCVSLTLGPVSISLDRIAQVLTAAVTGGVLPDSAANDAAILTELRAPRIVMAVLAGAGLSVAGVVLQAVVRNLLADPYVLGVNSGASCGAALAILFGAGAGFGEYALQTSAFLGALVAMGLVLVVARVAGRMTSTRLLMAGVSVGYALSALTSFLVFASDSAEGSRSVTFWLLGSLSLATWGGPLVVAAVVVFAAVAVAMVGGRLLDALAAGDETALTVGVNPDRLRLVAMVLVSVVVGVVVAAVGSIGFVGLVVPHVARRLVGTAHAAVVPVAALLGAVLLVVADMAARVVMAPQELPVGIITALVGTPLLLVLVRRLRAGEA